MARSPMKETFVMLLKPLVSHRRCQGNTPVHNRVSGDVKPNHRLPSQADEGKHSQKTVMGARL